MYIASISRCTYSHSCMHTRLCIVKKSDNVEVPRQYHLFPSFNLVKISVSDLEDVWRYSPKVWLNFKRQNIFYPDGYQSALAPNMHWCDIMRRCDIIGRNRPYHLWGWCGLLFFHPCCKPLDDSFYLHRSRYFLLYKYYEQGILIPFPHSFSISCEEVNSAFQLLDNGTLTTFKKIWKIVLKISTNSSNNGNVITTFWWHRSIKIR